MKRTFQPLATALAATLQLAAIAAVPLAWDVRPGQPAPIMFDRYHGETLSFSATFRGFGELPFAQDADIRLWYQTNGMGRAWWSVPATVQSNVLSAVWSPALDPGADRVSLFFGAPSNAFASAVLRLRPSPGFFPNVLNPPPTLVDLESGLAAFCATGTAFRAATIGTETRWIDVTGCVWEVSTGDWVMSPTNYTGDSEWWAGKPIYLVETHSPGEWWRPMCEGDYIGIGKGDEESISLAWGSEESYIDITATRSLYCTNLVGRALSTDTTQTTDPSAMLHDSALPSSRIVPDVRPSGYWPNRQRVLRLGDGDTVVTADRAEVRVLLVKDPTRLIFVDEETVDGNGQTNFTFKTFQQYLNAVSPETLQESLRGYLPIEGGGSVTGNVEITGDVLVKGTLAAPSLLRVVTADIEANGFSVSNGVLRANSGLVVSNGMCKINCARAVVGIGTPRVHIEGDYNGSGITFGGTWTSPWNDLTGLIHSRVSSEMYGYTTQDQSKEIAHFPPVAPNFRNNSNTLPDSVTPNSNGLLTLENLKLNVVDDAAYNEYVLIKLDELPNVKLVDLYVLFRYTTSVPTFYFDEGTFGESPVFHGDSGAFSPSAGTPRLVRMKHIGNDEWIVTYKDLTTWNPPMNTPDEQQ